MIRECEEHGYFRSEYCPICGEEGKFLMSDFEVEKLGRAMAGILRHGKFDLDMDDQGFVDMRDIVAVMKAKNPRMKWLRTHHIEAMADTDPKGRYQISGSDIRATYGHTIELSLRHPVDNIPDTLYYPTTEEECDDILNEGLFPTDRAMVHLSFSFRDATKVASARGEESIVILAIDTVGCIDAGIEISKAAKTVFLCDQVPSEFLFVAEAGSEEDYEDDDSEDEED